MKRQTKTEIGKYWEQQDNDDAQIIAMRAWGLWDWQGIQSVGGRGGLEEKANKWLRKNGQPHMRIVETSLDGFNSTYHPVNKYQTK